jgi:hypothetical protein
MSRRTASRQRLGDQVALGIEHGPDEHVMPGVDLGADQVGDELWLGRRSARSTLLLALVT